MAIQDPLLDGFPALPWLPIQLGFLRPSTFMPKLILTKKSLLWFYQGLNHDHSNVNPCTTIQPIHVP